MPRVALTEAQRQKQRFELRSRSLAGGLAAYKNYKKLTNEELAALLGVGKNTVTRLLSGDDVKLSIMSYWKLLDISGIELRKKAADGEF